MTIPASQLRSGVEQSRSASRNGQREPGELAEADTVSSTPTVAVVGLGYVGLPTALTLHETGARVLGLEISAERIAAIRQRAVDLVDDDRGRLDDALQSDRMMITSDPRALLAADAIIVCVPTPVDEHQAPDMRALRGACATVVANARAGQTIILTSTSYVGCTNDLVVAPLRARGLNVGAELHVAFSPERIDPGNVVYPQSTVPRVVGGAAPCCTASAASIIGARRPDAPGLGTRGRGVHEALRERLQGGQYRIRERDGGGRAVA